MSDDELIDRMCLEWLGQSDDVRVLMRAVLAVVREHDGTRELIERLRTYAHHSDECGDSDSYNNVEPGQQTCGCGLDSLLADLDRAEGKA